MTNRQFTLLANLVEKLDKELVEHTEILLEERPCLWEKVGIEKARENLEEAKKENETNIEILSCQIQNILPS